MNTLIKNLSQEEFQNLLKMTVNTYNETFRCLTKTSIEMKMWLNVLEGKSSAKDFVQKYNNPFSFDEMITFLKVHPMIASIYVRCHEDARK